MADSIELDKATNFAQLIDTLQITVDPKVSVHTPIFITSPSDLLGAAIIYLNFKEGKFDSISLIPYDTEEELKAAWVLAGEE
jgi:hypothetical protein